nr:MAG: putative zinc-finger DNA binding protein [Diabrotica toursvirus 3a]
MESNALMSKLCFWDKHQLPADKTPVMCPIDFKPKQVIRQKKEYIFNHNVAESWNKINIDENIKISPSEIYYDDIFCSKECCLAWINDNHKNPAYGKSKYLFHMLYPEVLPANHWRVLKLFGGFMSIEEFRNFYGNYINTDVTFITTDNKFNKIYRFDK